MLSRFFFWDNSESLTIQGLHCNVGTMVSYSHVKAVCYQIDKGYQCDRSTCFPGQLDSPGEVIASLINNELLINVCQLVTMLNLLTLFLN